MTISGAYGREYKNKAEILADWNDCKDFVVRDMPNFARTVYSAAGTYINKIQVADSAVSVRYNQDCSVVVLKRKADGTWTF